jgi:hypothetical protein
LQAEIEKVEKQEKLANQNKGMHKHFRMIAISENMRSNGVDPDVYQHTRIPYIWQKLRAYYNMDLIDERENVDDDDDDADKYVDFSLPQDGFLEPMMQRAVADSSEAPTSPPELEITPPPPPSYHSQNKRKRGTRQSSTKPRAASAEDTEDNTDAHSPAAKATRGARSRTTRAASKAEAEKAETTEEDEAEDGDESGSAEDEEESAEESGTPATRSTRAAGKARGQTRTSSRRNKGR